MAMKLVLYLICGQASGILAINPGDMVGPVAVVTSQWSTNVGLAHIILFVRFAANYIVRNIDMGIRSQDAILTDIMWQEVHIDHMHDGTSIMS